MTASMVPSAAWAAGTSLSAENVNALVMRARDGDPIIGDDFAQRGVRVQFDIVHESPVVAPDLLGHVLNECAAERHIDQLVSPTDREQRNLVRIAQRASAMSKAS